MIFVVDENSLGRLGCVLSCLSPDITNTKKLGLTGFSDPKLFNVLAQFPDKCVLVGRDSKMLSAHKKDLRVYGHSVLVLKENSGRKKRKGSKWSQVCGIIAQNWDPISCQIKNSSKQKAYKLDLRSYTPRKLHLEEQDI